MTAAVVEEVDVRLKLADGESITLKASLQYELEAQYAVRLVVEGQGGSDVSYELARELLQAGLGEAHGLGDARVWPSWALLGRVVTVVLPSDSGPTTFEVDALDVANFLGRTFIVVPRGEETVDVDAALTELGVQP